MTPGIDADSPIPRYVQLKEILMERILDRSWKPGDALPPERELCATHGLARMTVRQAVNLLVEEGYLQRRRGSGTFVASSRVHFPLYRLRGFTESLRGRGIATSSTLVSAETVRPDAAMQKRLAIAAGVALQCVRRVRRIRQKPFALEANYVSADRCPGLIEKDLANESLYAIYEKTYKIRLGRASWTIEATEASAEEAKLLEIRRGQPLLLLEGVTLDVNDRPVEFVKGLYRSDQHKFTLEMKR